MGEAAEQNAARRRGKVGLYVQAVRAFAFPASVVPVTAGAALALHYEGDVRWALFPLALLGGVLMHAGTNLVSEYYDLRAGVDRPETYGSSRVLVEGLLPPRNVLIAGLVAFAAAGAIGGVLVWLRGLPILWLGLVGLAGGFFYTGRPIGYKYRALGDPLVFVLMGPLMVIGSYYVVTGAFGWTAVIVSLPIGCLVTAILCGNNLRDIRHDRQAKIRTLEGLLGLRGAKALYCGLVVGAHAIVVGMVAGGLVSAWALLVFAAAWPAIRNVRQVLRADLDRVGEIATIDVRTAQHHLMFGVLLCVGLGLAAAL